jgi:glycosyltransferase involved in cell wall biosynthesis
MARVAPSVAGGAEQVLLQLDAALCKAGHRSLVIACAGSQLSGDLVESCVLPPLLDDAAQQVARRAHADAISRTLAAEPVDVVHMHGIDFHRYLPGPGPPVLVTLHLPLNWYAHESLMPARARTYLHCVSAAQHETRPPGAQFLRPIENGVEITPISAAIREHVLFLGRICREKGVHVAMAAARLARVPLVIAGEVFPYPDHLRYFAEEIEPHLDADCRFVASIDPIRKAELLAGARCILVPSLVEETSSLVAREALAAGTPVIAFRRRALTDTIEHGHTGFLVDSVDQMAAAIGSCADIDSSYCRAVARDRFPLSRMTSEYLRLYEKLAAGRISPADFQ